MRPLSGAGAKLARFPSVNDKNKKTHDAVESLPSYPSMQACSASTGIPKAVLQQAKRDGCSAFDQANRVHLGPLLKWLFRSEGADGEENPNWPDRLKRAQALRAEHELDQIRGKFVEIEKVHEQQDQCVAKARAVLTQKFETELPPKQDGCPAADIASLNRAALDQVFSILSKKETYT